MKSVQVLSHVVEGRVLLKLRQSDCPGGVRQRPWSCARKKEKRE